MSQDTYYPLDKSRLALVHIVPSDLSEAGRRARTAALHAVRDSNRGRAPTFADRIIGLLRALAAWFLRARMRANLTDLDDNALKGAGLDRGDLTRQI